MCKKTESDAPSFADFANDVDRYIDWKFGVDRGGGDKWFPTLDQVSDPKYIPIGNNDD